MADLRGADRCALAVRDLTVRFGTATVLRDLTFQVERGSSLAILGPNASGKTVLFRALIGAIPFTGSVEWSPGERIGYVPQKLDLDRDIPITANDFLRARAARVRGGAAGASIANSLALVGITPEVARQTIATLSAGQFQRVLIAFALAGEPTVLLLDEPTAGIDAPGQQHLNDLLRTLQRERCLTVLFISHELSVVVRYADNVLCLCGGRARVGPPRAVLTRELLREMYGAPVEYHVHGD